VSDELPDIREAPDGWTIASVRGVVDRLQYGISTKADAVAGTGTPILRMGNIQDGRLDISDLKFVPRSKALDDVLVARGDILFNRTNSPELVGKSAVIDTDDEMVFASYLIRLRAKPGVVDPQYLCWWINSAWGREWAARVRTDGVSQSNINGTKLGEMPLPLAPAPEQRRIVEAVEALLEQVNRGRERLDRVPLILKRFRQAVLAAACAGRLTEEWRDKNPAVADAGVLLSQIASLRREAGLPTATRPIPDEGIEIPDAELPASWAWCRVGQIADVRLGGTPSRKEPTYWNGTVPWVSSGEVANCRIGRTAELITRKGLENSNAKLYPAGSVLIAMIGEGKTRGQSAILEMEASTNQNAAGLIFDVGLINSKYIWYWALGEYTKNRDEGRGGNQPALNGAKVRALPVPLPPIDEQTEIVRQVERLFALADTIERRVQDAATCADRLPQAILSKAFSGELVPTEADLARAAGRTYETAAELLARIARERENDVETNGVRRGPKNGRAPRTRAE